MCSFLNFNKPNKILQKIFLRINERHTFCDDFNMASKIGSFEINPIKEKDYFCFSKKLGPMNAINTNTSTKANK